MKVSASIRSSSLWWKSGVAPRWVRRLAGKARRPRIPPVFDGGATPPPRMHRPSNAARLPPQAALPYRPRQVSNDRGWRQRIEVATSLPPIRYTIAIAYLAAHVPLLAPSLEDIDSINFALGLHHFDVASHQPHPPGYPIFIALGRVSLAILRRIGWPADPIHLDAVALAAWSALAGAVALVAAGQDRKSVV